MVAVLSTAILGAFVGSVYALYALGIVLTYRTSGVMNFAQGAMGMFFAFLYFQLVQGGLIHWPRDFNQTWHVPKLFALLVVVVVLAPAFGMVLDVVLFRKLRHAGTVVQIVATIGLLLALEGLVATVWTQSTRLSPQALIKVRRVEFGRVHAQTDQLFTLVVVVLLTGALIAFLRYTPVGIRMRAVVDRPEVAELMGVNSGRISMFGWGIATGFAALATILIAPSYGSLQIVVLSFFVIDALAVAVLARLSSLPLALVAGIGMGILQLELQRYGPHIFKEHSAAIPAIILFAALLLPLKWPTRGGQTAPANPLTADTSPFPRRLRRVAILAVVLTLGPQLFSPVMHKVFGLLWREQLSYVPALAVIFLSLVVLTGYAGQISLCQSALALFGAFIAGHLIVTYHVPFLLAAPLGAAATVPLGAALATRATRMAPLFLGLATLAVGSFMDEVVFTSRRLVKGAFGLQFHRTGWLQHPYPYYVFTLAVFGVCALLANNIRRSRTGLSLAAMRDSEHGLASLGTSLARQKLVTFCLSAFLAGLGGALFVGAKQVVLPIDLFRIYSLTFLALAVIGGISRWSGALVGAALFWLPQTVFQQPFFQRNAVVNFIFHGHLNDMLPVFIGLGAIGLARNPHGAIEQTKEGFAQFRERRRAAIEAPAAPLGDRAETSGRAVTFDKATMYHLDSCVLATGKHATTVTAAKARKLTPCSICEPPTPPPVRTPSATGKDG